MRPSPGAASSLVATAAEAQSKKKATPAKPIVAHRSRRDRVPEHSRRWRQVGPAILRHRDREDVKNGTIIRLPRHRGVAIVSFELHNRQMYSAELERSGRGYTRALATIVAAGIDGTLLQRNAVLSEFRTESDLIERIAGGAGPAGVKAVAPDRHGNSRHRRAAGIRCDRAGRRESEHHTHRRQRDNQSARPANRRRQRAQIEYQPAPAKKSPPPKKKPARRNG